MEQTGVGIGESGVVTYKEACQLLKISRTSLNKLVDCGDIPVVRLLRESPRILRSDLDRLIQSRYERATSGALVA